MRQKQTAQSGFTIIEAAILLFVSAVIAGAVWLAWQRTYNAQSKIVTSNTTTPVSDKPIPVIWNDPYMLPPEPGTYTTPTPYPTGTPDVAVTTNTDVTDSTVTCTNSDGAQKCVAAEAGLSFDLPPGVTPAYVKFAPAKDFVATHYLYSNKPSRYNTADRRWYYTDTAYGATKGERADHDIITENDSLIFFRFNYGDAGCYATSIAVASTNKIAYVRLPMTCGTPNEAYGEISEAARDQAVKSIADTARFN